MKSLFSALIQFQKNVKPIPKSKVNPFYNSRYAELSTVIDVCQPTLNEHGLAVVQVLKVIPETSDNALVTILCHESGETLESTIYLPKIADAQKLTGSITYLRRTSYLSILGLVADDDLDGNDVVEPPKPQTRPAQPSQPRLPSDAQLKAIYAISKKLNIETPKVSSFEEASRFIETNSKRS